MLEIFIELWQYKQKLWYMVTLAVLSIYILIKEGKENWSIEGLFVFYVIQIDMTNYGYSAMDFIPCFDYLYYLLH